MDRYTVYATLISATFGFAACNSSRSQGPDDDAEPGEVFSPVDDTGFDVLPDSGGPDTRTPDTDAADVPTPDVTQDVDSPEDADLDSADAGPPDGQTHDTAVPSPTEFCNSGEDDDGDGAADCADDDCADNVWCVDAPSWVYYGVTLWTQTGESWSVRAFRTDDLTSSVAVTPGEPTEGVYELPLSITPDGRILMLEDRSNGDSETWLLDLETGSRRELLLRDGWTVVPIGWSGPRELVGLCSRFGPPETQYCRLGLEDFDVELYAYDPDVYSQATLSLDGSGLYIIRVLESPNPFRPGVFRAELVLLDLSSGERTLVTESPPGGLVRVPALEGYLWGTRRGSWELRDAAFEWVRELQIPDGAKVVSRTRVLTRGTNALNMYSWTGTLLGEHDFRAFAGALETFALVGVAQVTPSPTSADAFVPFFLAD
jgi:hypothetical protein